MKQISVEMIVRTPTIRPNQLLFAVICGMKGINFDRAIPILAYPNINKEWWPVKAYRHSFRWRRWFDSKSLICKRIYLCFKRIYPLFQANKLPRRFQYNAIGNVRV